MGFEIRGAYPFYVIFKCRGFATLLFNINIYKYNLQIRVCGYIIGRKTCFMYPILINII